MRDEQVPFRMATGRSLGDGKIDVVEEGSIGDESIGGPVFVRGQ